MIHYHIEHCSHYSYQFPARFCVMSLCLQPRTDQNQNLTNFAMEIEPHAKLSARQDCFGNEHHLFNIHRKHREVKITMRADVALHPLPDLPSTLKTGSWQKIHSWINSLSHWDFIQPTALTSPSPALTDFLTRNNIVAGSDPLQSLRELNNTLFNSFQYQPGSTSVESTIDHILATGQGVCQDYAHVMLAIVRSWGIPARYVSGYLWTTGQPHEQAGSHATHAWVECLLPTLGWVGFDPTNATIHDSRHVRLAVGRDYRDVTPTRGVLQGRGKSKLDINVQIKKISPEQLPTSK